MRIGVVVPVYNRRGLVRECLESIAAQARPPERVVIVDDASTDGTADGIEEWIRECAAPIDWSLHRTTTNGGPSRARNVAIAALDDCDVIAFLDSDDLWPPDYLARAEQTLDQHSHAVATVCDIRSVDSYKAGRERLRDQRPLAETPLPRMIRRGAPTPSSVVVRRDAIVAAGGFDASLRYAEDLALYMRVARDGAWVHLPGEPITYRLGAGEARSEAAALSKWNTGIDRSSEYVRLVEEFTDDGALRAIAWFRASGTAARAGEWRDCRRRCGQVLRVAPWHLRAGIRWLRALVRGMSQPRT